MDRKDISFTAPRFILGLGVICIGLLFLLDNLDIVNAAEYFRYWPSLLILIGIAYVVQCRRGSGLIWGIFLIFLGTGMLLHKLYYIYFSIWNYWPLILIFIGITMITKAFSRIKDYQVPPTNINDANSFMRAIAVMGGFKRSNSSQEFQGGDLTAIMGGLEIDLRGASIKGDAVIDIFAMMGGVEMRVPEDWIVIVDGFPFMGGYEDKTRPPKQSNKRLIIKGTVIMGGVEIKN